ncbi:MAG TPA: class I SAM-dependent methyltransferase [Acidimicrobiales bacterium]|nr:class I SAM-dependent methyltransferase [Acidimicrobiales bacterium]
MDTDTTHADSSAGSRAWARAFAAVYDPFLWVGERAGLRRHRTELLERAAGRTIEIGAGTGLNLAHYPDDLDELVLVEPDAAMRRRLAERLARRRLRARLVDAPAERLPFPDGSVDTVVSTFVLCTVDAPDLALQEIVRVLTPDGQLLLIEHVRADSPRLARWQDRLAGPWRRFARGCRCNRATSELMAACGFELEDLDGASWRAMPPIVRPLIVGRAHKTAAAAATLSASTRGGSIDG